MCAAPASTASMCLEFTAGITPAPGEAFDLAGVLANAARDRAFVEELRRA